MKLLCYQIIVFWNWRQSSGQVACVLDEAYFNRHRIMNMCVVSIKHHRLTLINHVAADSILFKEMHVWFGPSGCLVTPTFLLNLWHKWLIWVHIHSHLLINVVLMCSVVMILEQFSHFLLISIAPLLLRVFTFFSRCRGCSRATGCTSWVLNLKDFLEKWVETWQLDISHSNFNINLVIDQLFYHVLKIILLFLYLFTWVFLQLYDLLW